MLVKTASGNGRLEKIASYSRAKRVGPFVYIAGTTSMQADGDVYAPYNTYEQTVYIFARMKEALASVGAEMQHVVRTTAFITDMRDASGFIKAHGEAFAGIDPVLAGVQAGLTTPGMMVEVLFDAVVHDDDGWMQPTAAPAPAPAAGGKYSAEFRLKVALEAIQGDASLAAIAARHGVDKKTVSAWKRRVVKSMAGAFSD